MQHSKQKFLNGQIGIELTNDTRNEFIQFLKDNDLFDENVTYYNKIIYSYEKSIKNLTPTLIPWKLNYCTITDLID
jgi:hypothetical protein